jgi:FtsZ-binding cell division protein ZapB
MEQKQQEQKEQQEQHDDLIYFDNMPETTHVSIFEMEDMKNKQLVDFMISEVMTHVNAKMNAYEEKIKQKDEEIQRLNAEVDQMKDTNKKLESALTEINQQIDYGLSRMANNLQIIGTEELCFQFRTNRIFDRLEYDVNRGYSCPKWHNYNRLQLSGKFMNDPSIIKLSLNMECTNNSVDISEVFHHELMYPNNELFHVINELFTDQGVRGIQSLLFTNYRTFNHPFIIMIKLKNKIIYTHIYSLHLLFGWNIVIKNFRYNEYDALPDLKNNYLRTLNNYQRIKPLIDIFDKRYKSPNIPRYLIDVSYDVDTFKYYSEYVCDIEQLKNLLVMDGIECI